LRKSYFILIIIVSFTGCITQSKEKTIEKYLRKAHGKKTEEYSNKVLTLDSLNTDALYNLGYINQENDSGIYYFKKSLEIDSNQAMVWYELGRIYKIKSRVGQSAYLEDRINVSQLDSAILFISKAIELDTTSGLLYYERGFCCTYSNRRSQYDLAKSDFSKACKLGWPVACEIVKSWK
tara:strand:- start:56 stop:592 length:537 start_codon:yes stop_codon:yes gene_type:complete